MADTPGRKLAALLNATQSANQVVATDGSGVLSFATDVNFPLFDTPTELTIATGSVTPTLRYHQIDTEADAATDDLTDIDDANMTQGDLLLIRAINDARDVVVKHSASGNHKIVLADAADYTLDDDDKSLLLQLHTGGEWHEVARPTGAAATPTFTESFVSAAQTITAAGTLTIAHGLSTTPTLVAAKLKNTTAEHNYALNDEIWIPVGSTNENNSRGVAVFADGTNLEVRFGSNANTFQVLNWTTGASANATNANWDIIFYAWA